MNGELSFNADIGQQTLAAANNAPPLAVSVANKSVGPDAGGMDVAGKKVTEQNQVVAAPDATAQDNMDALQQVTDNLTATMSMMRKGLQFKVDEKDGVPVVSVIDVDSGDLIRQIPSQDALDLAEKMSEIAGLLMKTEA